MSAANTAPVLFDVREDRVAVVTLNRPAVRNAINGAVAEALEEIVDRVEADASIRTVVLASSHETVFCAGADLSEIAAGNAARLSTSRNGFAGFIRAHRTKPWIAAVDGAAFAGGCEIVLACDMVVASSASRFALPEVKRGLYAGAGAPYMIARALPRAIGIELLCTGDPIDAERAFALGMVNRLSSPGQALQAALSLASTIAANAPLAVRETLAMTRVASDFDEDAFWDRSAAVTDRILASTDAKEGTRAFLEKRAPVWTDE